MAIEKVGWTIRPKPLQNDGERRQQPKRKQPKQKPRNDSNRRPGSIDELA